MFRNTTRFSYIEQSLEIIDLNEKTLKYKTLSASKSVVEQTKSERTNQTLQVILIKGAIDFKGSWSVQLMLIEFSEQ